MTTAASNRSSPEGTVPDDMLRSFAEKAITGGRARPAFGGAFCGNLEDTDHPEIKWLGPTTAAIARLPWYETNLPDGRYAPQPEAAAELLWLLVRALDDNTVPPTGIVPTWRGGVAAEWHIGGFDLEIECDPDRTIEYNFAGPGIEEYEGPVDESLPNLGNTSECCRTTESRQLAG